ncbi:hypothetical protein [Bacillus marinisedimentorum]|uniref:hypothetical protein n=1 Tax=Bacillus marinisedimentorum TaxID=1821260 RepID=UPI0007E03305|nr:hypothetical protein [Bacillus marinisedimentorum]
MNKKIWIILIPLILVVAYVGFYYQTHISIWGFSLSKNDINQVIVSSENEEEFSQYLITNQKEVLEIAKLFSKSEKYSEIKQNNFPPDERPEKYTKILLQTQDNTTYGGSLWIIGTKYVQDSSGYYWKIDYEKLSRLLNEAIPSAKRLH